MQPKNILRTLQEDIQALEVGDRKVTLGQVDCLLETLQEFDWFIEHYPYEFGEMHVKMAEMTRKQKSYIYTCLHSMRLSTIKDILTSLGIEYKTKTEQL